MIRNRHSGPSVPDVVVIAVLALDAHLVDADSLMSNILYVALNHCIYVAFSLNDIQLALPSHWIKRLHEDHHSGSTASAT